MNFLSYGLSIAVITILSVLSYAKLRPEWYEETRISWGVTSIISGVFAAAATTVLHLFAHEQHHPAALVSLSILLWLFPLVCITDFTAYKIPREVSRWAFRLALLPMAWYFIYTVDTAGMIAVGVALVVPVILVFTNGIGMGDIRLLSLFAVTLPWWTGILAWVDALLITAVIGIITFLVARFTKHGKPMTFTRGKVTKALYRLVGKKYETYEGERTVLPFGPSLLLGFAGYGSVIAVMGVPDASLMERLLASLGVI